MNKSRTHIYDLVSGLEPYDDVERETVGRVLARIGSGQDVRLLAYFPAIDRVRRSVLLMDHISAGLWLPTAGCVEPDEDPHQTVQRALTEELGPRAAFVSSVASAPLFVTAREARGSASHTDVSLWYVVFADERMWVDPDPREYAGHRWVSFEAVLALELASLDPGMHRFIRKLETKLPNPKQL